MGLAVGAIPGLQIGGAYLSGKARRDEADAFARAARFNAALAEREGAEEEKRRRIEARRHLGKVRVSVAKRGIQMSGTTLESYARDAYELERDALQAGLAARATADLERARASSAERIGRRAQIGELLGGAARAGRAWWELR